MNRPEVLVSLGYSLAFREDGFVEVLVSRGDERWLGRGDDRDAAFRDAMRQMFPSWGAQEALRRLQIDPTLVEAPTTASKAVDQAVAANPDPSEAVEAEPQPPTPEPIPSPPKAMLPERASQEVLAEVEAILEEVLDAEGDIALMTPRLVELNMLAWIGRVREHQSEYASDHRLRSTVARVASTLSRFAKRMAGGTVTACDLDPLTRRERSSESSPVSRPLWEASTIGMTENSKPVCAISTRPRSST